LNFNFAPAQMNQAIKEGAKHVEETPIGRGDLASVAPPA